MIAVDTNFLVYARRTEAIHHVEAKRLLADLSRDCARGRFRGPASTSFCGLSPTHACSPLPHLAKAVEEIDRLFDSPAITLLGEGPGHRAHLRNMVTAGRATGNVAHDASYRRAAARARRARVLDDRQGLPSFSRDRGSQSVHGGWGSRDACEIPGSEGGAARVRTSLTK